MFKKIFTLTLILILLMNLIVFYFKSTFSLHINIIILLTCTISLYSSFIQKRIGVVSFLYVFVVCLPFIHLIPYLWFDFNSQPKIMWGMISNFYQHDYQTISLLSSMSVCSVIPLTILGILNKKIKQSDVDYGFESSLTIRRKFTSLPIYSWSVLLLIGIFFSYISAPQESIFTSKYTTSTSLSRETNFASAWLCSYILLIFCGVDLCLDTNKSSSLFKKYTFIFSVAYIVLILQFMRGDRESLPWALSIILIFFYWCRNYRNGKLSTPIPKRNIYLVCILFFFASMLVAVTRSSVSGSDLYTAYEIVTSNIGDELFTIDNAMKGTWSAVLLTPLSVAGDYYHTNFSYNYAKDYLDFILSIPPGFVADTLNYQRPIGSGAGPATEMRFGQGGTHSSVLPFRSIGLIGISLVHLFVFYILTKFERFTLKNFRFETICVLAVLTSILPHWLWYGQKNLLNAIVYFFIILFVYYIFIYIDFLLKTRSFK